MGIFDFFSKEEEKPSVKTKKKKVISPNKTSKVKRARKPQNTKKRQPIEREVKYAEKEDQEIKKEKVFPEVRKEENSFISGNLEETSFTFGGTIKEDSFEKSNEEDNKNNIAEIEKGIDAVIRSEIEKEVETEKEIEIEIKKKNSPVVENWESEKDFKKKEHAGHVESIEDETLDLNLNETSLYSALWIDGENLIENNPKEIERRIFARFLFEVKNRIGDENLRVVESYQDENGLHIVEALLETNMLKPKEVFNIYKRILEEEKIGGLFLIKDYKAIEVEKKKNADGEDDVIFKYEGKRLIPKFALSGLNVSETISLLPYDEYKKLKLSVEITKTGELKFTFTEILRDALYKGASDIHIVNKPEGFYVAFRIKKQFIFQPQYFMNKQEWFAFSNVLNKLAADENTGYFDPDNRRINQEARITFPELNCSVRYEFIPDGFSLKYGEIICRILKKESVSGKEPIEKRMLKLGYDEKAIKIVKSVSNMEGGLAIVSGKTNSGKSTLIAQILASIPEVRKAGTIEDPIEYTYANKNIIQHQLYLPEKGTKMDFTQYVKAFKRADYDVILVGEWRRSEGLTQAMVEQAEAGQLIFTTLHIASAYDVYLSLYNIFEVPFDVSANLIIFSFNQTLAPIVCPHCSDEVEITFDETEVAPLKTLTDSDKIELLRMRELGRKINPQKAKRCPECNGIGYSGFTPIYEYFVPNEEIRQYIVENGEKLSPVALRSFVSEIQLGTETYIERGLATFKKTIGIQKLKEGRIDKDTLLRLL